MAQSLPEHEPFTIKGGSDFVFHNCIIHEPPPLRWWQFRRRYRWRSQMVQPWEYDKIRPDIKRALDDWGSGEHPYTGDFLRSVLAHDLFEAVLRADDDNRETLVAIVGYIYNRLPSNCHGSYEIVDEWAETHRPDLV